MSTFTIRIKTTDKESSKWIWDSIAGKEIHGVTVEAISNGDMFRRLDLTDKQLDLFEDVLEDLPDDDQTTYDELQEQIEKTWERN